MSDPRDAPTPRLSATWQANADLARALADRLRARELELGVPGPRLDTRRAGMLRHLRCVLEHYAAAFGRWVSEAVPIERRAREQREFSLTTTLALAVLVESDE